MIILGLGSNVGDRLNNLRRALNEIKKIPDLTVEKVSPIYLSDALLPENAPREWYMPYLNAAIRCHSSLEPYDLLENLKKIEWSIGRKPEIRHWGPRIIDIDILAYDDLIISNNRLVIPHNNLIDRPFALWPLADIAPFWKFPLIGNNQGKTASELVEKWGSRFSGDAPLRTKQIYQRIDSSQLVGILNITPDSFSDGGENTHLQNALTNAIRLVARGAEILDIGAEATSPAAKYINAELEWQRLEPVLDILQDNLHQFLIPPKISIDTRRFEVAAKALSRKIDWINDVSGFQDPAMCELLANHSQDCVVMHSVSIPANHHHYLPRDVDVVQMIYNWCESKITEMMQNKIREERIIIDPGIGFGKRPEQSLQLIQHIEFLKKLPVRLLVGPSRKRFLSLFTDQFFKERDIETASIALHLDQKKVDYIRVHNVELCSRAIRVTKAI